MIKEFYIFFLVVFIISCNQNKNIDDKETVLQKVYSSDINQISNTQNFRPDSVEIRIVSFARPVLEATYVLKNDCIDIVSVNINGEFTKKSCQNESIRRLKRYLSMFYLENEKIELKHNKRDYIVSGNYPRIDVNGYQDGKEIFNKQTQIGEDTYDVIYHPEFLEFYEFLNEMAMANRSSLSRGIDRVEITGLLFDKNFNRNKFKIFLINDKARIFNSYKNEISNIYDINKINLLITYVNQLYVDKNIAGTNIINEKVTDETAFINIKGYRKGKEIFNKQTLIENKIYNPDFEEFILFLSNMIINE